MPPTTTRIVLRQEIIKKLYKPRYPIVSTTTDTAGDTTSVDDTILAGGGHDTDYIGAWIIVAETVGSGPALGEVVRVTNINLSASPATLDPTTPAFSLALQTGTDYEIHYKYHPSVIEDKINEVLDDLEISILLPLTIIVDGDMEDDPATNFAVGGTETLANETTIVLHGKQSLKVTAGADDDYAKSTTAVNLPGSTEFFVSADCFITTGDSAKLILYDETNAANIETAESDETGWVHLEFTATSPETAEEVSLRLESQSNGDIIYWDNAVLLPTLGTQIEPPSEAEYAADFGGLFYWPRGANIPGDSNDLAYYVGQGGMRTWGSYTVERDDTAVVPFRISVNPTPIDQTLFIETDVDFASLTSDTATTKAPKILVRELALALLWDDMADEEDENNNLQQGLVLRKRAEKTRRNMRTTWSEFRPLRSSVWGAKR